MHGQMLEYMSSRAVYTAIELSTVFLQTPSPLEVHVKKDAAIGLNVTTVIACNNAATAKIYYYLFST